MTEKQQLALAALKCPARLVTHFLGSMLETSRDGLRSHIQLQESKRGKEQQIGHFRHQLPCCTSVYW